MPISKQLATARAPWNIFEMGFDFDLINRSNPVTRDHWLLHYTTKSLDTAGPWCWCGLEKKLYDSKEHKKVAICPLNAICHSN